MVYFLHATACAALFLLGACGKTDTSPANSGPAAQVPSISVPLPSPAVEAPKPKVLAKTYDGPLGLAMGIQIKELVEVLDFKDNEDNFYSGTPPRPVPGFDRYYVTATPLQGICKVMGVQAVENVNGSGDQLKAATDLVSEMVELKYGKPTKKYDHVSQDVYKRNPEFWMMALGKSDAVYAYDWKNGKSLSLPSDITHIEVAARSSSTSSGSVLIKYTFSNEKACYDEVKRKKASNL